MYRLFLFCCIVQNRFSNVKQICANGINFQTLQEICVELLTNGKKCDILYIKEQGSVNDSPNGAMVQRHNSAARHFWKSINFVRN